MVTSESGSVAVEDGAGVAPSGGWGAVLRAAAWSREWGQPSSRRPRLMQVDLLSNDTFSWLYTWSLVSHEGWCPEIGAGDHWLRGRHGGLGPNF